MTSSVLKRLGKAQAALLFAAALPLAAAEPVAAQADKPAHAAPAVFQLRPEWLAATKAQIAAGDRVRRHALAGLLRRAEEAMEGPNYSVTFNKPVPPSGDKHDYMSTGPYWWPNPDTENGLPWIRRDGQVNPATQGLHSDSDVMGLMSRSVTRLGLAYYFTGEDRYAKRAAELVDVFFLQPITRMHPNLNFGQGVPGRTDGRGIGIIETRHLMKLVDAVGLLESSDAFSAEVTQGLQQWFAAYLDWLVNSPNGRDEQATHNNHGTFYDAQLVHYALFTGREALAADTLSEVPGSRLEAQVAADGSQSHELARTRPFHYSAFNLQAFFALAELERHLPSQKRIDLWHYQTSEGAGLRQALDYLNTYQTHPVRRADLVEKRPDMTRLAPQNQMAALVYGGGYAERGLAIFESGEGQLQCLLLFPSPTTEQLAPLVETLTQHEAEDLCTY